jgi:hypothetical protein
MLCLLATLAFAAGFDILLSEANSPMPPIGQLWLPSKIC